MTNMTLQAVRQLIANDSYAITFQSIEQYRATLLRHFDSLAGDAVASQQVLAATEDHVLMPRHLTAENGAKGLLSGEFMEAISVRCHECDGEGYDPQYENTCAECKGDGTVEQPVPVDWDTIKRIYAMAVEHLAAPAQAKPLPAAQAYLAAELDPAEPVYKVADLKSAQASTAGGRQEGGES